MVTKGGLNTISIHSGYVNISVARETLYENLSQWMSLCSVKYYAFLYSIILVLHIQEIYFLGFARSPQLLISRSDLRYRIALESESCSYSVQTKNFTARLITALVFFYLFQCDVGLRQCQSKVDSIHSPAKFPARMREIARNDPPWIAP
jgi:hypothetical protein